TDVPRMPAGADPNATRVDSDDPLATRPEAVRRDPAPRRARGYPAQAGSPAGGASTEPGQGGDQRDQRERPAARAAADEGSGAVPAPHRAGRRRSASHEPEHPAATTGPRATTSPSRPAPIGPRGVPPALGRPGTPPAPGRPGTPGGRDEPGGSAAVP